MSNFEAPSSEPSDLLDLLSAQAVPVHQSVEQEQLADKTQTTAISEPLAADDKENQSGLLPETRRALVALLRNGVIMAANKRLLFETLCRDRLRIQSHLADMYLHMLLDEQAGLVILLQRDEEQTGDNNEEISTLISRRTLTLFDTLLLLVLRKHYQQREAAGEQRVMVDIDRIEVALQPFLPLSNSSRSDRRRLNGSLSNMKERRILTAVRGEEDRFEITPVIRYVVNAACLEQMLDEYRVLAGQAAVAVAKDEELA